MTLAILVVGETRGFLLATIVLLHVAGFLPAGVAIACVATVMCLGGAASAIGGANLQAWYGAILPEPERRFVAPRVMGITQGLGAALLLPVALAVQGGRSPVGLAIYAAVFLAAGLPASPSSAPSSACGAPGGFASRATAIGRPSRPRPGDLSGS